jgi:hypothetical protein
MAASMSGSRRPSGSRSYLTLLRTLKKYLDGNGGVHVRLLTRWTVSVIAALGSASTGQ